MTSLTTPDNIVRWTTADPASLVAESEAQGDSIQAALLTRQGHTYRWANAAARTAQSGMVAGSYGYQIDTDIRYRYSTAGVWTEWEKGWTTWTPVLNLFPVSNPLGTTGSATGMYCISGGRVQAFGRLLWQGSSITVPSTGWGFALPYAMNAAFASTYNLRLGLAEFRDVSVTSNVSVGANLDLSIQYEGSTGFAGIRQNYSGASGIADYGYLAATQSGIPTIATGDYLTFQIEYPV